MDPFELIEEANKRANTLQRSLTFLALQETEKDKRANYKEAAAKAESVANDLYDRWNSMLTKEMLDWQARAGVTADQFSKSNANLKRAISNLETAVDKMEGVVRAIQRLEEVAGIVARIAAIV